MFQALVNLLPKKLRPVAKAVVAFTLPLVAQIVVAVNQNGLTVGNAIRSVVVAAVIGIVTHQVPNQK